VRKEGKCLIRTFAQIDILLPTIILANDERAYTSLDKAVNDAPTGNMQITIYLPIPLVSEGVNPMGGMLAVGKQRLIVCAALVIELVQCLERTPVDQKGHKARLVCG
jgi:hypothetical protein